MNPTFSLRYTGQGEDPITGGYLLGNGYRTYLPSLMRFSELDTASPFDEGGVNPYAYCAADPINYRDPSGHIALPVLIAIGAVAAIGAKFVGSVLVGKLRGPVKRWINSLKSDGNIGAYEAQRASSRNIDNSPHVAENAAASIREASPTDRLPSGNRNGADAHETPPWKAVRTAKTERVVRDVESQLATAQMRRKEMHLLLEGAKNSHDPALVNRLAENERRAGLASLAAANRLIGRMSHLEGDLNQELSRKLNSIKGHHDALLLDLCP